MRIFQRTPVILGGLALFLMSGAAHGQVLPTWSFQLLDGQQPANSSGIVSGNPLGTLITYTLNYTFTTGSPLTPGVFEIGGYVTETDLPTSGNAIDLAGATITSPSVAGPTNYALNNDGTPSLDFFYQNDDGSGNNIPTWSYYSAFSPPALAAGTSESIDLGQLDVTKFLAFVDANNGPGDYVGSLDYTASAIDDATNTQLNDITTGPPSIQINVHILPVSSTPEPGSLTMLLGLTLTGAGFMIRRRK